jgi:hypothetical protein
MPIYTVSFNVIHTHLGGSIEVEADSADEACSRVGEMDPGELENRASEATTEIEAWIEGAESGCGAAHAAWAMAQTIPAGTRVRILPPRNAAGNIIPDKYQLAGKLGTAVKQTGESSILILLDIGGEWRVDLDRVAVTRHRA